MPFSELRGWEPKGVGQRSYKKSERVWTVRIHPAGSLHCAPVGPLRKDVKGINIHPSEHKAARSGDSHPRLPPEVKIARKGLRKVKGKARKKKHYYRRRLLPFRPAGQRRKSPQKSCLPSVTQMLPLEAASRSVRRAIIPQADSCLLYAGCEKRYTQSLQWQSGKMSSHL